MPPLYLFTAPSTFKYCYICTSEVMYSYCIYEVGGYSSHPIFLFNWNEKFHGGKVKSYGDYYVTVGVPVDV